LARKEFERAKHWAEDDLLLQLIESTIGLVTGKDGYFDTQSFYTEQLANPSLSSPHLLTARGVTRLLRGEVQEAKSDLEEAVSQQGGHADAETLAASVVAAGLGPKKGDVDELWRCAAGMFFLSRDPDTHGLLPCQPTCISTSRASISNYGKRESNRI
jgi:coatomer protein complex subunit epsilon